MIDGKSGQKKIKTLVKSVDEASRQYLDPKWEFCVSYTCLAEGDGSESALCVCRGTSTRSPGRTRGRPWAEQITGSRQNPESLRLTFAEVPQLSQERVASSASRSA